jgi:hypothetical protein
MQYNNIAKNIIALIKKLKEIEVEEKIEQKLFLHTQSELLIKEMDLMSNGTIDSLIRKNKITNQMATSLMNDSYYKNEITSKLISVAEIIYNNDISEELTKLKKKKKLQYWFQDPFGLSEKKLDKALLKLSTRKNNLKAKLKKQKDTTLIQEIQDEINIISKTLLKYKR